MQILIVSIFDDNFGDMLIRQCFEALLRVAIKNLDLNCGIELMPLKEADENKIRCSDGVFFAGGALFGISYENFFDYLEKIVDIADEERIPVIFSSVGFNNLHGATMEGEMRLKDLLHKNCVKAVSVRDDVELYREYAYGVSYDITPVCDPAVWAKYVCRPNEQERKNIVIGINVVRGGLFADNLQSWKFKDELKYLNELRQIIDDSPYDYCFYTNGSILDNNALHYFAREFDIPSQKTVYINSTYELVQMINGFNFVVAIRMHSSIIAYALGIPAVNLVWNDKVMRFYDNIGRPQDAIVFDDWNAERVFEVAKKGIYSGRSETDEDYLMSVYEFIFDSMSYLSGKNETKCFSFKEVKEKLTLNEISQRDKFLDYEIKLKRAEKLYLDRFTDIKDKDKEIKNLKKKVVVAEQTESELKRENKTLKKEIKLKDDIIVKKQSEMDKLHRHLLVRLDEMLRNIVKCI